MRKSMMQHYHLQLLHKGEHCDTLAFRITSTLLTPTLVVVEFVVLIFFLTPLSSAVIIAVLAVAVFHNNYCLVQYFFCLCRMSDKEQLIHLTSGDIVVFGGPSRMVFHTVPTIFPNTAPKEIAQKMQNFPGRFNLTFRQGQYFEWAWAKKKTK